MWFIVLGVLLLLLKLVDVGPPGAWSWWVILSPFGVAAAWWWWADATGFTKRAEMRKMDERKNERRRRNMVALGIDPRSHEKLNKRAAQYKAMQSKQEESIERKRTAERKKQHDSIIHSRIDSAVSRVDGEDTKR
ncbi:TIGR04438 family Trp-rich protein [Rivibacter subsaxonicus]|uniref:Small Trp-rich protein n=1 Tax=Rivibacter subsaxonicus TaxID=457575 RepID=A0A4Q7VCS3_9BURK|nr:small Trp-rich protein [Rivibacter subsaxonicus]